MTTTEAPRAAAPMKASLTASGGLRVRRKRSDPNWIAAPSLWTPVGSAPAPEPTPDPESTPDPEPTPDPGSDASAWNPRGTYAAGDVVTWQGAAYVAVQAHTGNGDEGWITAPSLWRRA